MLSSQKPLPVRLHGLDTLRAVAIVAVILYHLNIQGLLPDAMGPVAEVGWAGVDLFFVLSGFLIGGQLFKPYRSGNKPSLREFYARRAYRILPAFFVVLLLYLLIPLWREAVGPYAGWQYASFTWNLLLLGYPQSHAFSHVWSLCVEEHFYLVFPLLTMAMMRRASVRKAAVVLVVLTVGGIALRAWLLRAVVLTAGDGQGLMMMKYIYYPTYSRLDGLATGVCLAAVRTFKEDWWSRWTRFGGVQAAAGLAGVAAGLWLCGFGFPDPERPLSILFAFPVLSWGFGLLVASAASENSFLSKRVPGASGLATLAFSLYLTHKSVAHAVHLLLPKLTAQADWRSLCLYAVACLGVASLLYFGVERPFLRLRVRWSGEPAVAGVEREVRLDQAV